MKGYLSIREAAEKWGVLCRGAYSRSAAFRYLVGNSGYCKQAG